MSPEIRIVTDSTACLTKKDIVENKIRVVPLAVIINGKTYRDGVDLDGETFTKMQQDNKALKVTTSLPSGKDFSIAYGGEFSDGNIISIHMGSAWSGTFGLAKKFSEMKEYSNVTPIDSRTLSAPLGNLALTAAKLAKSGDRIEEIAPIMNDLISRYTLGAVFDDLEYPFNGGRISRTSFAMGTLLNIKPIMQIAGNKEIIAIMKKRGTERAIGALEEFALDQDPQELFVVEGGSEQSRINSDRIVADLTRKTHGEIPVSKSKLGTVLGAHAGPDVFGVALLSKRTLFKGTE
jgi:DegV family protein with EDD domain